MVIMFQRVKRHSKTLTLLAILLLSFIIVNIMQSTDMPLPGGFQGSVGIEALSASINGVDPNTGFLITSSEVIPEQLVRKSLQINPSFEYDLKKQQGGKEYKIVPTNLLQGNTLYKISFDPQNSLSNLEPRSSFSWAFQTKGDFSIDSILPSNASTGVPINTVIELGFNQSPNLDSVKKSISFEPNIAGQWSLRNNTAIFIPAKPLEYAQIYKIIISGTMENLDKTETLDMDQIVLFETASNSSNNQDINYFELSDNNKAFRTLEVPYFRFYQNSQIAQATEVRVWRYTDVDKYKEAMQAISKDYSWSYATRDKLLPTQELIELNQFNLEGQKLNGIWYFIFPEAFETGLYLAEFTTAGVSRQSLFQVSDISGYLANNEDEALLWVNDLRNGQPIRDAKIQIGNQLSTKTDQSGVAILSLDPNKNDSDIIEIISAKDLLIMNTSRDMFPFESNQLSWYQENKQRQAYWNYLYVDRPLYRPGDEINFIGLLAPRDANYSEIKEVTIKLYGGNLDNNGLIQYTLPVEDGFIQGKFNLPMLTPNYYYLSMYVDDVYYCSAYFSVELYQKPAYKLIIEPDKKAVLAGEKIEWTTEAAFFEGTPLPELSVGFEGDLIKGTQNVMTDQAGFIKFRTETKVVSQRELYSRQWLYASSVMPETGEIYRQQSIYVFNSDIELIGEANRDGNDINFEVIAKSVEPAKIKDWHSDIAQQSYSDLQESVILTATLKRHEWDKTLRGSVYDPYTKQNKQLYDYQLRKVVENTFDWNCFGTKSNIFTAKVKSSNAYTLTVQGIDRAGRTFIRDYYLPAIKNGDEDYRISPYYWLNADQEKYLANFDEEVILRIYNGEEPLIINKGNILFFRSQQNILDYRLLQENEYLFKFNEKLMPNVNVMAVYYDGHNYYPVNYPYTCRMKLAERQAKVLIKADKDAYRPGDKVKLEISLMDHRGRPKSGYVNLNLVDEALLAIQDQVVEMGQTVFWGNPYSFTMKYTISHEKFSTEFMAEGGGEGDGIGSRTDFKDAALFKTIKTNKQGKGSVEFEVPDNLTTWRVIWQAYIPDIWVGNGTELISVKLPFFSDVRFGSTLVSGDVPILGLRCAGTTLSSLDTNSIIWTVNIPEINYTKELTGPAFIWNDCQLPAFDQGNYTLTVTARYKELTDTVSQSFKVVDSRQSYNEVSLVKLIKDFRPIGNQLGLTRLNFTSKKRNQAMQGLYKLANQENIRLEQRLSSYRAQQLLKDKFGQLGWQIEQVDLRFNKEQIMRYQKANGGISILPYSEASLELSALAASVAADYFDQNALIAYFNNILADEETNLEERSIAFWGAAALGQPVLNEVSLILNEKTEALPGIVRLNLLLAKTFAGDGALAKQEAIGLIREHTEDLTTSKRANLSEDPDLTLTATARLAMLANLLDLPAGEKLYQYVLDNQRDSDYYLLEQLIIIKSILKKLPEVASFTYTLDGRSELIDLVEQPSFSLTLTPQQLAKIEFKEVKGEITVLNMYENLGLPKEIKPSTELSLSRKYEIAGQATTSLPTQGKILVSIDYHIAGNAPAGCYNLVDFLPAGLRFVAMDETIYKSHHHPWLLKEDSNKLVFGIVKDQAAVSGKLNYYARVAMPGTFIAEEPYLIHSQITNILSIGEKVKIHIN